MGKVILIYVGDGSGLPGLPARDVTEEEIKASKYQLAQLLATGLYVDQATTKQTGKKLGNAQEEK